MIYLIGNTLFKHPPLWTSSEYSPVRHCPDAKYLILCWTFYLNLGIAAAMPVRLSHVWQFWESLLAGGNE